MGLQDRIRKVTGRREEAPEEPRTLMERIQKVTEGRVQGSKRSEVVVSAADSIRNGGKALRASMPTTDEKGLMAPYDRDDKAVTMKLFGFAVED